MLREIGSNFWISPEELIIKASNQTPSVFGCEGSDYVWTSTGRSATAFVLDCIERRCQRIHRSVVVPPFTCHTVLDPFISKGYEIYTYNIGKDLLTTADRIIEAVTKFNAGVLLFHRYFGVDTIHGVNLLNSFLKHADVVSIEDCTQMLYSGFARSDVDFYVGSIRKWCGVPDGGFAVCRNGQFENKPENEDKQLIVAKKRASLLKYAYIIKGEGDKSVFLEEYRKAENILDAQEGCYTISELSASMQSSIDFSMVKRKRTNNYDVLTQGLNGVQGVDVVFKKLKDNEVPLYCPVLCSDRKVVQQLLASNNIYAPVVWPKPDSCPEVDSDSDFLYEHLLCIPIDQRYDEDDMMRIVSVLSGAK